LLARLGVDALASVDVHALAPLGAAQREQMRALGYLP